MYKIRTLTLSYMRVTSSEIVVCLRVVVKCCELVDASRVSVTFLIHGSKMKDLLRKSPEVI